VLLTGIAKRILAGAIAQAGHTAAGCNVDEMRGQALARSQIALMALRLLSRRGKTMVAMRQYRAGMRRSRQR
jgi:hypothetical protein